MINTFERKIKVPIKASAVRSVETRRLYWGSVRGVEIYVWRLTSGDECPDVDYSCVNLKFSVETSDYLKFYFSFDAIYEKHYLRSQSGKNHHIY